MKRKSEYFVHKTALVETKKIGIGSRIWAFVHILPGAKIGKNANIGDHCFIENKVIIGDNVTIKNGVYIWDNVHIENNVFIGPAVVFINDRYPKAKNKNFKQEKTFLKAGCSIGANATLLPGITIGEHALIGAGSLVNKNIPDYAIVYGNPARIKRYLTK